MTDEKKPIQPKAPGKELVPAETTLAAHHAEQDDTSVFMGRAFPYPVYTVVFGLLGILTVTEVILSEVLADLESLKIILLLAIAFAKASLVALYYMHLKDDDRAFVIAFGVPATMVILSILFLLGVPTGY